MTTTFPTSVARPGQLVRIGGVLGRCDGVQNTQNIRCVTATSDHGHELVEMLDWSKRGRVRYIIGTYVDGQPVYHARGQRNRWR